MQSPIGSAKYLSREMFEAEQAHLFRKYWIFVGMKQLLNARYAFISRQIAGEEIVVQNVDGELIAYRNVCPHKQLKIQSEKYGKRPMICRFHGWVFEKSGKPKVIPHYDELYRLTGQSLERMCLKMYSVKAIGNFVFVNLADTPIEINEQFSSEVICFLEELSPCLDDEIAYTSVEYKSNWKLGMEIIQDGNHIQFLHARTLSKLREMPSVRAGAPFKQYSEEEARIGGSEVSLKALSVIGHSPQRVDQFSWFEHVQHFDKISGYLDVVLFPNTHIISATEGRSFSIEYYHPLSEDQTEVEIQTFLAKRRSSEIDKQVPVILLAHFRDRTAVFAEDVEALESVATGMSVGVDTEFGIHEDSNYRTRYWFSKFASEHGV
jgi:phenylpropionate dioxygenase-like ring-hydroxylating dioxygenase large terminal subunit